MNFMSFRTSTIILTIFLVLIAWEVEGQSFKTGIFKGTVYSISRENIKKGYGDHVYSGKVLGKVEFEDLKIPYTDVYHKPFPGVDKKSHFGIVFENEIEILESGCYELVLKSDDGSKLWLDSTLLVDNDYPHGMRIKKDTTFLESRLYDMKLWYYNAYVSGYGLELYINFLNRGECPSEKKGRKSWIIEGVSFETNSYTLTNEGKTKIDSLCSEISEAGIVEIVIEGHTDNIGSESYNKQLSLQRANAVKAEIHKYLDVPNAIIRTAGYGSTKPIDSNNNPEGRYRNRRVEITILRR